MGIASIRHRMHQVPCVTDRHTLAGARHLERLYSFHRARVVAPPTTRAGPDQTDSSNRAKRRLGRRAGIVPALDLAVGAQVRSGSALHQNRELPFDKPQHISAP